jgi:hypothetical protein
MTRSWLPIAIAALFIVAGCAGNGARTGSAHVQRRLVDLHDISQLRTAFNKASGEPRLIVLVSPT